MAVIRTFFWAAMVAGFLATDSISRTIDADSIALRLRNVLGEDMAEDSLVVRLKSDVRRLQEQVDKSAEKPMAWMLGLAEGYRNLVIVYTDESDKPQRQKDTTGEGLARNEIEYSKSQMKKYMRVLWAADSNNIEVLRQYLVISQDKNRDIQLFDRLIVHPGANPGDKQDYLGFLSTIQDTGRALALASKCEKDTSGIGTNPLVGNYLLSCAETLERFARPKSAIRIYMLLAKADPNEFKGIADKAIPRLNAAATK